MTSFEAKAMEVYPSAGFGHLVTGGYPLNSHEAMPSERMLNYLEILWDRLVDFCVFSRFGHNFSPSLSSIFRTEIDSFFR